MLRRAALALCCCSIPLFLACGPTMEANFSVYEQGIDLPTEGLETSAGVVRFRVDVGIVKGVAKSYQIRIDESPIVTESIDESSSLSMEHFWETSDWPAGKHAVELVVASQSGDESGYRFDITLLDNPYLEALDWTGETQSVTISIVDASGTLLGSVDKLAESGSDWPIGSDFYLNDEPVTDGIKGSVTVEVAYLDQGEAAIARSDPFDAVQLSDGVELSFGPVARLVLRGERTRTGEGGFPAPWDFF